MVLFVSRSMRKLISGTNYLSVLYINDLYSFFRGTYCALAVATLLNILTPTLAAGIPEFIQSCQTYEGGFSSSSQPYYTSGKTLAAAPRPPLGEAHGGYTACALGSWLLLEPVRDKSQKNIDIKGVLRWLSKMQGINTWY